jgi:hypothetical protein
MDVEMGSEQFDFLSPGYHDQFNQLSKEPVIGCAQLRRI